jgi:hypothetical protein
MSLNPYVCTNLKIPPMGPSRRYHTIGCASVQIYSLDLLLFVFLDAIGIKQWFRAT